MRIAMWRYAAACLVGILCFHFCRSQQAPNYTFLHEATSAPPTSYYDYIIVGGGTAGCPLAATLSQKSKVLLIERGGSPYGNPNITNMASYANLFADTSPSSPSQRFVSEDGVNNNRARVLGGGTCINGGLYSHASAEEIAEAGWDVELVEESYKWVEKVVVHEPPVLQWQSAIRDGLLEADVTPYNGFTFEHINGTKVGGTIFDEDGHRHTAADLLQYADPNRLTVLLHATVNRIFCRQTKHKGSKPRAYGVVFSDAMGAKHRAYLNKAWKSEIIVSAGAIGSPQLLMLSGIGPTKQLQSLGINMVLDQPTVGQGMSDNPSNIVVIPSPSPVEISHVQVVGISPLGIYIEGTSGFNFWGLPDNVSPQTEQSSMVPPESSGTPEPEVIGKAMDVTKRFPNSSFRGASLAEKVARPLSTGHLELKNRNAGDNPKVTFNYFKEPSDLQRCVEGMTTVAKVIDSKAFSSFRYPNVSVQGMLKFTASLGLNSRPRHNNDSTSLEQYCKDTVLTYYHYHGGCQVGRVVDRKYRVLGVDAIRVVDGSTFISSPGTNPQATLMMLGRYVGVEILKERFGTK